MSTQVFPTLAGLGWNVSRSEIWKTRQQANISGKEVRIADWSYPRHQWALTFDFLRQAGANMQAATFAGTAYAEFAQLAGFFDQRQGGFDSFLYADADDNTVVGQGLGTADGVTTVFPLVRAFGGYAEPILAPNLGATFHLYNNGGSPVSPANYTVTPWGTANANGPGQVIFNSAPANGHAITADFSWYFPCRFGTASAAGDTMDFDKFMAALYSAKKVTFISLK